MSNIGRDNHQSSWRLIYLCAVILLSVLVFGVFLYRPGINGYSRAMFGNMIYGTAAKPYVYRALLPYTVRVVVNAIPDETKATIGDSLGVQPAVDNLFMILGWEREYLVEYFVAGLLMYMSLWGFVWALRYLLGAVYRVSDLTRDVFTLAALAGLTQFFRYYSYLYDFPAVFLFTFGLALLVRSKWKMFLLVYLAACLNKETAILLTVVYAIYFRGRARLSRSRFASLMAIQLAIFAAVKIGLYAAYRDNPGALVEVHLPKHNLEVLGAYPLSALFGWCGLTLLLFYKWREKPLFLQQAVWIVPPLIVLTFLFGYIDELRDYYEVYPVVLLLLLHSISKVWDFKVAAVEN